ncbi:MAG: TVP38/TMEM64 family protein, partial [Moorea sp. SIO2B7]|nr:TVP38/TMEM64 family protein [Moorena sp. SIO2B7]
MTETKKKLNSKLKLGIIAVVVAGLIISAKQFGITEYINSALQSTLQWIESLGFWGPVAFIVIY